jgi:transcriptional regulator with XRE-family HTH domain
MTIQTDEPEMLRREITAILDKVTDRGSLLYFHWLLKRIANNEPLPPIEELRRLHGAFVRVTKGFRERGRNIDRADMDLVVKYVGTGRVEIARPLGMAVKFYRRQRNLTRLELSKRCRMPVRAILALERGQVRDMSLPRLEQLGKGLGVDPGVFMSKVMEFERAMGDSHFMGGIISQGRWREICVPGALWRSNSAG